MSEITLKTLRAKGACKDALSEFERRFGERVVVTETLAESVSRVFYWDWAAAKFLSNSAWVEYRRARDQARAEYDRICARTFARLYAEQCCKCGHHDRYHFDDGEGSIVCRAESGCDCVQSVGPGEEDGPWAEGWEQRRG